MVAVLLSTMQQHPSHKAIEESVIDMLWDVSSTSDGQAHTISEPAGPNPILPLTPSLWAWSGPSPDPDSGPDSMPSPGPELDLGPGFDPSPVPGGPL